MSLILLCKKGKINLIPMHRQAMDGYNGTVRLGGLIFNYFLCSCTASQLLFLHMDKQLAGRHM